MNLRSTATLSATALALALAPTSAFAICSTNATLHPLLCAGNQNWGGNDFGAGYSIRAGVIRGEDYEYAIANLPAYTNMLWSVSVPDDYAWAGGAFDSNVRLFGTRKSVVEAELSGKHANGLASTRVFLRVAGVTIVNRSSNGFSFQPAYTREIAAVERTFIIGGLPVTVEANASGTLGVDIHIGGGAGNIHVSGEPYVRASIGASAGVGMYCAQVGIRGEMTALRIGVPADAALTINTQTDTVDYGFAASYSLSSLDGTIELFGEVCGVGADLEIYSWNGQTWAEAELFSINGDFNY